MLLYDAHTYADTPLLLHALIIYAAPAALFYYAKAIMLMLLALQRPVVLHGACATLPLSATLPCHAADILILPHYMIIAIRQRVMRLLRCFDARMRAKIERRKRKRERDKICSPLLIRHFTRS